MSGYTAVIICRKGGLDEGLDFVEKPIVPMSFLKKVREVLDREACMQMGRVKKSGPLDRISIRMGDLTQLEVDAVVNAANSTLLGGGGVDGMIHWAAGSGLLEECRAIGWCPTGEARITKGYDLPAGHIIHTVGPVFALDREKAPHLLASCYRNCLALAVENGLKSLAFPSISTGSYGYPVREACRIALDTTLSFLERHPSLEKVVFVLYSCPDYQAYGEYYEELRAGCAGKCGVEADGGTNHA